jgi:hypothetical protein
MPRYRPAARIRRGKTASQTCICARVVSGSYLRTSAILDQGPIDTCDVEIQTSTLQSIHCGLPASWTRARRHPPSSPSPVASRGGGRGLVFLNWTRVQLDLPPVRREASRMGVHAQISSEADLLSDPSTHGSSSTDGMVRIPGETFRMGSDKHGGPHLLAPNYCRRYRPAARHAQPVDTSTSHFGFCCVVREGHK